MLYKSPYRRSPYHGSPYRRSPYRRSPYHGSSYCRSPYRRSPYRVRGGSYIKLRQHKGGGGAVVGDDGNADNMSDFDSPHSLPYEVQTPPNNTHSTPNTHTLNTPHTPPRVHHMPLRVPHAPRAPHNPRDLQRIMGIRHCDIEHAKRIAIDGVLDLVNLTKTKDNRNKIENLLEKNNWDMSVLVDKYEHDY